MLQVVSVQRLPLICQNFVPQPQKQPRQQCQHPAQEVSVSHHYRRSRNWHSALCIRLHRPLKINNCSRICYRLIMGKTNWCGLNRKFLIALQVFSDQKPTLLPYLKQDHCCWFWNPNISSLSEDIVTIVYCSGYPVRMSPPLTMTDLINWTQRPPQLCRDRRAGTGWR